MPTPRRPRELRFLTEEEPAGCEWCGTTLPTIRHWRTTFCGKACNNAYFNKLTADARAEERARLKCRTCGGPIVGAKKADTLYCSPTCAGKRIRCEAVG